VLEWCILVVQIIYLAFGLRAVASVSMFLFLIVCAHPETLFLSQLGPVLQKNRRAPPGKYVMGPKVDHRIQVT
jgi:hypothetical protein